MPKLSKSDQLKIKHLKELFFNREDRVPLKAPWGSYACPTSPSSSIDALVTAHVVGNAAPRVSALFLKKKSTVQYSGHFQMASYAQTVKSMSRWVCIDIDGDGHACPVADIDHAAKTIIALMKQKELTPYLERSSSNKGWHIWCFFDKPIYSELLIHFFGNLIPTTIPLKNGSLANPMSGMGIEIFPKRPKVGPRGYGSLVWLPWHNESTDGANEFHVLTPEGEIKPILPTEFLLSPSDNIIRSPLSSARSSEISGINNPPLSGAPRSAYREWRAAVLAVVDLKMIYGKLLTERLTSEEYYECRDPESPTGDRNPSAGVSTGKGGIERGTYNSFRNSKRGISAFDFLVKYNPDVHTHTEACDFISELTGIPLPDMRLSSKVRKSVYTPDLSLLRM